MRNEAGGARKNLKSSAEEEWVRLDLSGLTVVA